MRGGDGHAPGTDTITSLRAGTRPLLSAVASSANGTSAGAARALEKATYATNGTLSGTVTALGADAHPRHQPKAPAPALTSHLMPSPTHRSLDRLVRMQSTADVAVSVTRVADATIELLPLPGRYLSAPSDQPSVSVRLNGQTTARCAAPNWDALHVGCFDANATHYVDGYATKAGAERSFPRGFSLERCAHHCMAHATTPMKAVGFAAQEDTCTCLASLPTAEALPSSNCSSTCSAVDPVEGTQMCGNGAPYARANVYKLPGAMSSTGTSLPCSFKFASAQTAALTGADKRWRR